MKQKDRWMNEAVQLIHLQTIPSQMFWDTCKATWWGNIFWIIILCLNYYTLTTCNMTMILAQQQTSNTLWLQPKWGDLNRGSLIGVHSALQRCSASFMMKTLFGVGRGSRFLLTLKVGQEKSQTPEHAPVTTSTLDDTFHLTVEAFWSILMCINL